MGFPTLANGKTKKEQKERQNKKVTVVEYFNYFDCIKFKKSALP